ncbi:hypothetical protein ACJ41O_000964 [Fusarium nematophilum]
MSMSVEDCTQVRQGFPRPFPNTPNNVVEQLRLNGKVVVVTGAADGIGFAVAEAMAEAGGNIALWYNSNDAAIKRAKELSEGHGTLERLMFSSPTLAWQSRSQFSSRPWTNIGSKCPEVDGVVFASKYAGEIFKRQGYGNLIITSSMSAHIVNVPTDQPVYNASKAFITHFGKSLAREWREFARVNIVSPGFFDTKMGASPLAVNEAYRMSALGRQGHVKEIKGLYLYLASDASTYMTGSDILIDGGYVLP